MLFSCRDKNGDLTTTTLSNNSGYSIELQEFFNGEFQSSTIINNNDKKKYSKGGERAIIGAIVPPFDTDSIWIIYYEKASIMHTANINSPVSRSLMLESSYEGGKVSEGLYEFTYTFTPADFEEAMEFGD